MSYINKQAQSLDNDGMCAISVCTRARHDPPYGS